MILPLLFAIGYARADQAADRDAIDRLAAALNQLPRPSGLFTADAVVDLNRLPAVPAGALRVIPPRVSGDLTDVAMIEGTRTLEDSGTKQIVPLLLVGEEGGRGVENRGAEDAGGNGISETQFNRNVSVLA